MLDFTKNFKNKKLLKGIYNKSGRNNSGKITIFFRGSRKKKRYRFIDFHKKLWGIKGLVIKIEYDPNRSSFISLIFYSNGILSYILAFDQIYEGYIIENGIFCSNTNIGNTLPLKLLPVGSVIHNIEIYFGQGGQFTRSAGSFAKILHKRINYTAIKLSSKQKHYILSDCLATLGRISNINHNLKNLKKAGTSINLGFKSRVRGCAMNPVDHPHGGRTKGGKIPVSRYGIYIGKKTKKIKKNLF